MAEKRPGDDVSGGIDGAGAGAGSGGAGGSAPSATNEAANPPAKKARVDVEVSDGALVLPEPKAKFYTSRDELAKAEEDGGGLEFRVIENDGHPQHMVWLVDAKNIFAQQLPKMPREYICRLVLDRNHRCLLLLKQNKVVGGVCYRPYIPQAFAEIAFLAVTSSEQVRGYGTRLMNHLKEAVKLDKIRNFLTYADNYAIGYFEKQGFTKHVTMKRERWVGFIKDYDGGTLMECSIYDEVNYLDIPGMLRRQRDAIVARIHQYTKADVAYPPLDFSTGTSYDIKTIPGFKEAGWLTVLPAANRRQSGRDGTALHSQLTALLKAIKANDDAWAFLEPVSPTEVPDYYEVVKDPIDLSMVTARVESGSYYKSLDMFHADLKRIISNCRLYNKPDTPYYACADRLETFINAKMAQLWQTSS